MDLVELLKNLVEPARSTFIGWLANTPVGPISLVVLIIIFIIYLGRKMFAK